MRIKDLKEGDYFSVVLDFPSFHRLHNDKFVSLEVKGDILINYDKEVSLLEVSDLEKLSISTEIMIALIQIELLHIYANKVGYQKIDLKTGCLLLDRTLHEETIEYYGDDDFDIKITIPV